MKLTNYKILVAIPTYRRYDSVPSLKLFPYGVLFVSESEESKYREHYPDAEIVTHPDTIKGLTPKLNFILRYAIDKGYDGVVKVDDDFKQGVCLTPFRSVIDNDEIYQVLESLMVMCHDSGTNLFTFNQTADIRRYEQHYPIKLFSSVRIGIYGVLLKDREPQWFDERFILKQDMDYAFQTVYKYRHMLVDYRYSFVYEKTFENVGGCSTYRNTKTEESSIDNLRRKWGSKYFKGSGRKRLSDLTVSVMNPMV